MGRPKKDKDKLLSVRKEILLTKGMSNGLTRKAKLLKEDESTVIRMAIENFLDKNND
jgi:hypothetical protein